ncbi:MAG: sigma-70 family RNA polymerase sigma factor [Acidobacteriota bacterium]|nr:MAG: sigma-70 family RNA polymerase sigma factor [Acidobacteriota bacterium]
MYADLPDRELVQRVQRGDERAFDELVGRYGRLVLSLARKVTANAADADDVAQEAFLRFFRSIERVDAELPLEPWLVRLTLNTARSYVSRSPARFEQSLADAEMPTDRGNPARRVHAEEITRAVMLAAGELPPREREGVVQRDLEELPVSVIAQALEVSEVTVRRQSGEARRKIVAWIKQRRPELLVLWRSSAQVPKEPR